MRRLLSCLHLFLGKALRQSGGSVTEVVATQLPGACRSLAAVSGFAVSLRHWIEACAPCLLNSSFEQYQEAQNPCCLCWPGPPRAMQLLVASTDMTSDGYDNQPPPPPFIHFRPFSLLIGSVPSHHGSPF